MERRGVNGGWLSLSAREAAAGVGLGLGEDRKILTAACVMKQNAAVMQGSMCQLTSSKLLSSPPKTEVKNYYSV